MKKTPAIKTHNKYLSNILLGAIVFLMSCHENVQPSVRDFFIGTKSAYYSDGLDSMGIMRKFGLDSIGTVIDGITYWKIANEPAIFFHLQGLIRMDRNKIFVKPEDSIDNKEVFGADEVLFSFDRLDLNKSWYVSYTYSGPIQVGDSVALRSISFDNKSKDTVYTYVLTSIYSDRKTNRIYNRQGTSIFKISKLVGFLQATFTNGLDSTSVNFYPYFFRLDSNVFRHRML
jgi:hypothetical protein